MVPSGEVLLHGPGASWGPAVWRGEPGVPQHRGHADPQLEGGRMLPRCHPDVPTRAQLATVWKCHLWDAALGPTWGGGLRWPWGCTGNTVSPAHTTLARGTKARLLTAGEERLSALLSRVYSSSVNLGGLGRRREWGAHFSHPPRSVPLLHPTESLPRFGDTSPGGMLGQRTSGTFSSLSAGANWS